MMVPLRFTVASKALPLKVLFLQKHFRQPCHRHSKVCGTEAVWTPCQQTCSPPIPIPVKLHCRAFPHYNQIGNIWEQRSQNWGTDVSCSNVWQLKIFEPTLKIGWGISCKTQGFWPLRRSDSTGWHWVVAAAFRWGLRCPICHSPYHSFLFLISGLFHLFGKSVWPV